MVPSRFSLFRNFCTQRSSSSQIINPLRYRWMATGPKFRLTPASLIRSWTSQFSQSLHHLHGSSRFTSLTPSLEARRILHHIIHRLKNFVQTGYLKYLVENRKPTSRHLGGGLFLSQWLKVLRQRTKYRYWEGTGLSSAQIRRRSFGAQMPGSWTADYLGSSLSFCKMPRN